MFNPTTGRYQGYVETWHRQAAEEGQPYCLLERIEPEGKGDRAFVGRVGSRSLGLAKSADGLFSAWRESIDSLLAKRVYEKGDTGRLPSLTTGRDRYETGEIVTLGEDRWLVLAAGTK
jgi:hypothetical protein